MHASTVIKMQLCVFLQVTNADVDLFFAPLEPHEELQLPSESVQARL